MSHEYLTGHNHLPLNRSMDNGEKDPAINGGETSQQENIQKEAKDFTPTETTWQEREVANVLKELTGEKQEAQQNTTTVISKENTTGTTNGSGLNQEGENLLKAIRDGQVGRGRNSHKNPTMARIMMENAGISQEEYDSLSLDELLRLYEQRAGQQASQTGPETAGSSGGSGRPPAPPGGSGPNNENNNLDENDDAKHFREELEGIRQTLRNLGRSEEEVDKKSSEFLIGKANSIIENAGDFVQALDQIKELFPADDFKRYTLGAINQMFEEQFPNPADPKMAEWMGKFGERLRELMEQDPGQAKEGFRDLFVDIIEDRAAAIQEAIRQQRAQEDSVGAGEDGSAQQEIEGEQGIDTLMLEDMRLVEGLGGDPEIDRRNLVDIFKSGQRGGEISTVMQSVYGYNQKEMRKQQEKFNKIFENPDIQRKKAQLENFIKDLSRKFKEDAPSEDINSIQELLKFIAGTQDKELYGPEGLYPLYTIEDGKEIIHPENLIIWERDSTVKKHKDNTNDPMSPLQSVGIVTRLGLRSIYTMGREARDQYFRDETTGIVRKDIADSMMTTAWAFGVYRNNSLGYTQIMHDDGKLPEAVGQVHAKNDLTRGETLATMFSLPEKYGTEGDTKVGDAVMFANDIYYNIGDPDELKKIIGDKLFTKEDFVNALKIIQEKKDWATNDELDNYEGHYDKNDPKGFYVLEDLSDGGTRRHYLFDEADNLNIDAFKRLNFYTSPTFPLSTINLFRELVRGKMNQKFHLGYGMDGHGTDVPMTREKWENLVVRDGNGNITDTTEADRQYNNRREADRINIEYAEIVSFSQQRPYGIGAKNDTARRGHDAATKLYIEDYLLRQSGERTAGPIGVPDAIGIFKALSVDFWVGLKTESGESPYELFMQVRDLNNDPNILEKDKIKKREEIMAKLRFRDNAEQDFATNQEMRGFQIFESLSGGQQLDLSKIVTHTFMGGIKYDPAEFEKQVKDGFIKPMRYAFSSNAGLRYAQEMRFFDYRYDDVSGEWVGEYRDGRLADRMFGPEVLSDIREQVLQVDQQKKKSGDKNWEEFLDGRDLSNPDELADVAYDYMDTSNGRIRAVKNAARARLAAQLRFHRKLKSVGETWGYGRTQMMIHALETIQAYERDPDNPGRAKADPHHRFFSEEDIEWIRKHSGTEVWRLLLQDTFQQGGAGMGKGLLDAFKIFFGGVAGGK